jgi:hypothetical protein
VQVLGRARKAALPHHLDEHAQPARIDVYSHLECIL